MNEKNGNIFSDNLLVFVGIGLAVLYWFVESLLYVFSHGQSFFQQLFQPDLLGLYRRLMVFSVFLLFGSHAQAAIKKLKETEADLRDYSKRLEQEVKKKLS
ncbi:MAG: hypothetical protein P1P89_00935 [Desulfobacterales bacterium]|nr:hypothetical protein [Desulfobacterales bacterium]